VRQLHDLWVTTRDSVEDMPAELIEQVAGVVALADSTEAFMAGELGELLSLGSRISEQTVRVAEELDRLTAREVQARQEMFTRDAPPIWRAMATSRDTTAFVPFGGAFQENVQAIRVFAARWPGYLAVTMAMMLVFPLAAIRLRGRSGHWPEDDRALKAVARILQRPVSAGLFLALVITFLILPRAPAALIDVGTLIAIVPVVRLLSPIVHEHMRRGVFAVAALYAMVVLSELTVMRLPFERLEDLTLAALSLGYLITELRAQRRRDPEAGVVHRVVVMFGSVATVPLVGSLLANVLGYLTLAELLVEATVLSAFYGFLLYAGAMVVTGAVTLVLRAPAARMLNTVRLHGEVLRRKAMWWIRLGAVVLWGVGMLSAFGVWLPLTRWALGVLTTQIGLGTIQFALGDALAFVFVLWLAIMVSRVVRFVLGEEILPRTKLPRGMPGTITMLLHYAIVSLGFFIAVGAAGVELGRLAILAGALGVGIGFGLQGIVNNFVSGLVLAFERPIQVGDVIQMGAVSGRVGKIGLRSSTIRMFDGSEVIVPNANLVSNEVTNWTLSDRLRRLELSVGVEYGTDPRKVLEILDRVAKEHQDVLDHPVPLPLFVGFGDSSLDFLLRFWTAKFEDFLRVSSEVRVEVYAALNEANITIPFPQRDLHLRSVDGEAAELLAVPDAKALGRSSQQGA
jgi:small-conductance mechanosensitive channel